MLKLNVNKSLSLLSNLHGINLDSYHLSPSSILNIAILRDENLECKLGSVLINQAESLSSYYKTHYIIYEKKKCSLCNSKFKIWDMQKNCGYEGCVYSPCHFQIIPLENLESYHIFGNQNKIDSEIGKLNLDKSQIFFVNMSGGPEGLYLSKIPLPENLKRGSDICWSCTEEMDDNLIFIWGH